MTIQLEHWTIAIFAAKRNVFFSISDPQNKVKKLVSAGLPLRAGVTRDDYNKLDDRKNRRKKRSLRMFINNQKRSPAAHNYAWKTIFQFIQDKKLLKQKFKLSVRGSNYKLTQKLAKNIVKRHPELKIHLFEVIDKAPHNGCKLKIKKRKKNKGKNRRRKQLATRPSPLKKAPSAKLRLLPFAAGADLSLLRKMMEDPQRGLVKAEREIRTRTKQAFAERQRAGGKVSIRSSAAKTLEDKYQSLKGVSIRRATLPQQSFRQFKLRRLYFKKLKKKQQSKKHPKLQNDANFVQSNAN